MKGGLGDIPQGNILKNKDSESGFLVSVGVQAGINI